MKKTIEQEIAEYGQGMFQTVGDSMEPLLHHRKSTVVIKRAEQPLKRYDVALYRRPAGEYVLHRVLKVRKKDYLICGDNRVKREAVPREWVIGVMTGFYEDERDIFLSCDSNPYKEYLAALRQRYMIRWIKAFPVRAVRKLKGLCRG